MSISEGDCSESDIEEMMDVPDKLCRRVASPKEQVQPDPDQVKTKAAMKSYIAGNINQDIGQHFDNHFFFLRISRLL